MIIKRKNNNNESLTNDNDIQVELDISSIKESSFYGQTNSEILNNFLEYLQEIQKNPDKSFNDFEYELAHALKECVEAENSLDNVVREKLYKSALEHAEKAKKDKDCKWPYDNLLDSLIDYIQVKVKK